MGKIGPKQKSKAYHEVVSLRALADEMAEAMISANPSYVAEGKITPKIRDVWNRYVEYMGKHA